jgi:putative heme-binding domain-containing protein
MPHNFVIIRPGSLETIGAAAEATATDPTAAERQYVPKSDAVLRASRLLQPGQTERISFVAPSQPGVYPFVCTYPGHWRTMHGALYVVADLEAYQANPEAYVAANPVRIDDPMLKDRRPRTEWKFDDLAEAAANLKHGRSYAQGKELFKIANCHACHKLEGVGQEYGPNLTEFDTKWTPLEVWKEMVDPSARINEKYQSYVFQLASGKTVTGLIVRETADAYQVAENPIAGAAPIVLKKDDVEAREKSPTSLMPKGLLDKLSRDEILDLLAYVASRGRSDHPLFRPAAAGAGGHGGHGARPRP